MTSDVLLTAPHSEFDTRRLCRKYRQLMTKEIQPFIISMILNSLLEVLLHGKHAVAVCEYIPLVAQLFWTYSDTKFTCFALLLFPNLS